MLVRLPASRLVIFRFVQMALPLLYPILLLLQPQTTLQTLQPLLVLLTSQQVPPLARLLLTGLPLLPPLLRRPWPQLLLCASRPP